MSRRRLCTFNPQAIQRIKTNIESRSMKIKINDPERGHYTGMVCNDEYANLCYNCERLKSAEELRKEFAEGMDYELKELKTLEDTIMETTGEQDEAFAKVRDHLLKIKAIMSELEVF